MLQRLGEGDEERVHADPVVDVDVGQAVADHVVEEAEVEEATLLPVHLGVGEDEVEDGHQKDVAGQEDQEWVVASGAEGVGEEDEDEESADDLEEDGEEEDGAVEEGGQVAVQGAALEGSVVEREAPRQGQDRRDDGDRLVGLEVINRIINF